MPSLSMEIFLLLSDEQIARHGYIPNPFRRPTTTCNNLPESSSQTTPRPSPTGTAAAAPSTYIMYIRIVNPPPPTPYSRIRAIHPSHRNIQRWLPRLACSVFAIGGTKQHNPYARNRLQNADTYIHVVEIFAYMAWWLMGRAWTPHAHVSFHGLWALRWYIGIWPASPRSLARFPIRRESSWVWVYVNIDCLFHP